MGIYGGGMEDFELDGLGFYYFFCYLGWILFEVVFRFDYFSFGLFVLLF
jgi:hypothetical protein